MSYCRCQHPRENDRRPGYCRRCGVRLSERWLSSNQTILEFQQQLAELPGVTAVGLLHSIHREFAGRSEFGLAYLGRDNAREGQEEAADGQNYCFFEWLNDRRKGIEDIDPDLLDAAHHFALAHAALERRGR